MRLIAGLVVIVIALLCSGCGGPSCSATSCQGCCLAGVCHGGDETPLCGFGGAFCTNCAATNQVCASNSCVFGGAGGGVGVGGGGAGVGGGGAGVGGGGAGVGGGGAGVGGGGAGVGGGGAGVGGGGGGVGGGNVNDPCMGVPANGNCLNSSTIQQCVTATGNGQITIQQIPCGAGTTCQNMANGAQCVLTGQCTQGQSQCLNSTTLQTCDTSFNWQNTSCPNGCSTGAGSSFCKTAGTVSLSGTVMYETRGPNATYPTDWSGVGTLPAPGLLVLSNQNGTFIDAQLTDNTGTFTVQVPQNPTANDSIIALAAALDSTGNIEFLIADPKLSAGTNPIDATISAPGSWGWGVPVSSFPNGSTVTITEAQGSGAIRLFYVVDFAYQHAAAQFGGQHGKSIIAWFGYGEEWGCGSCMWPVPTTAFGINFDVQVFYGGNNGDQEWWADAVTAHEMGHWVMSSYGLSPNEGGQHCVGGISLPGLAWSEGWATFHSSDVRNSPVYYDKQQGSMFYFDIDARQYSGGIPWTRPDASQGLLQQIDENEVSATLWSIRNSSPPSLYAALASARMTSRINQTPSLRGYTRHTWSTNNCVNSNIVDTGIPAPFLADFLDAMVCSGLSASSVDSATNPSVNYPYPSNAPLCQ